MKRSGLARPIRGRARSVSERRVAEQLNARAVCYSFDLGDSRCVSEFHVNMALGSVVDNANGVEVKQEESSTNNDSASTANSG